MTLVIYYRAVGRSENPGVPVLFGGHNMHPLVKIGLTDLPKSGGTMAPPVPPGTITLRLSDAAQKLQFVGASYYMEAHVSMCMQNSF